MKSIKTTIGGALEVLGTTLVGIGVVPQLTNEPNALLSKIAVAGFVIGAAGKFCTALFAADNSEVQKALAEHSEQIAEVKGDTTRLMNKP